MTPQPVQANAAPLLKRGGACLRKRDKSRELLRLHAVQNRLPSLRLSLTPQPSHHRRGQNEKRFKK
jgi:hypothetical protein